MDIFKKTALLGTDRSPLDESQAAALVENGIDTTGDLAYDVLNGLAVLYIQEKVGTKFPLPKLKHSDPPPPESENLVPISATTFEDFELLASGLYPQALPLFVHLMQQEKRCFAAKDLPIVLDRCIRKPYFFQTIRPVLDKRAFWLMGLNPEWTPFLALKEFTPMDMALVRKEIEGLDEKERQKLDWFLEKMVPRFKF